MADHNGTPPAGALTTVFTPVPSCAAHTDGLYWISTCMMEGWENYSTAPYYSPGICPSGQTNAGPVPSDFGPPMEETETGIMCCQTGLTITSLESATLLFQFPATEPFFYFCHTEDPNLSPSVRFNYAVQVRWAASDLPALETDPLNPGQPPRTTAVVSVTTTKTNTETETRTTTDARNTANSKTTTSTSTSLGVGDGLGLGGSSGDNTSSEEGASNSSGSGGSGLSKGAIAGIAVGSVVLVLAVILGALFLTRKRWGRAQPFSHAQQPTATTPMAGVVGTKVRGGIPPPRPERPPTLPQEYFMGPVELPGGGVSDRVELPGRV